LALIGTETFATMDSAMAVETALLNLVLGIDSPPQSLFVNIKNHKTTISYFFQKKQYKIPIFSVSYQITI
jgi:hypothetical protein